LLFPGRGAKGAGMDSLPDGLRDGVRFRCTECGACCTGAPGRVRVSEAELAVLAAFRNQPLAALKATCARRMEGEWLLVENPGNGDCVFFKDNRCAVHPVKPTQCRLYPFWFRNVRSDAAWARTCAECPGIGQGDWIAPEEIIRRVREDLG